MYFLYKHYKDNKVFYVGIGKQRNNNGISKYHRAYDESKRSVAWKEIAKDGFRFEIVEESEDRKHIMEREKYWIKHYGRRIDGGKLVNILPGGNLVLEDPIKKRNRMIGNKNRLGKKFSEKSIALISYKSKGNKNAIGYRSYAAKLKYSFAKLGNTYAKGKFGNKSGKLLNVETGLIFDNIHEINDFFFNGSVKTFLTLKTYIAKGVTFKGLTFYRV